MSPGGGGDCKERCNNCVLILTSKDEIYKYKYHEGSYSREWSQSSRLEHSK
jgi:hypothetical protein